jgi:hypothetical protein
MKAGLAAGAVAWYLDEKGLVRPWRRVRHAMFVPSVVGEPTKIMELFFRVKACPPPIGCAEWPAGRVLLEMALDMIPPSDETVLEIGAGVGVTALGLAKSSAAARALHIHTQPTAVVATDICEASLENLRTNAASNGITVRPVRSNHEQGYHDVVDGELPPATLTVGLWDAAGGQGAVQRLNLDLGIDARDLTHVLGADIMYHGFDNVAAAANEGLVSTLAALLKANPNIQITLLLVDRFSGGAVAAVSQARMAIMHDYCIRFIRVISSLPTCLLVVNPTLTDSWARNSITSRLLG